MFNHADHIATHDEAMREYAANAGGDRPEQAWILTSYDVWMPNPYYNGPDVPHPESEYPEFEALEDGDFEVVIPNEDGGYADTPFDETEVETLDEMGYDDLPF